MQDTISQSAKCPGERQWCDGDTRQVRVVGADLSQEMTHGQRGPIEKKVALQRPGGRTFQRKAKWWNLKRCCFCCVAKSCPTLLWPHELQPTRLLCPWDFPGKNTRVGHHFLLQGIFPTQESNPHLRHCMWVLYHWATWEDRRRDDWEWRKSTKSRATEEGPSPYLTIWELLEVEPSFLILSTSQCLQNQGLSQIRGCILESPGNLTQHGWLHQSGGSLGHGVSERRPPGNSNVHSKQLENPELGYLWSSVTPLPPGGLGLTLSLI